ncbi:tyrosine-type recombinase/integrase [Hathewaya histolytica]|uniref:tyrosine-type recombinase/integrase n=1 Tax=Hathewaya histolytica TaxID=1498 RepID=UPI003B67ADD7
MFYPKKLTKILKTINIDKNVRCHDLRHTNATLLLYQGMDFKVIQERLAHRL